MAEINLPTAEKQDSIKEDTSFIASKASQSSVDNIRNDTQFIRNQFPITSGTDFFSGKTISQTFRLEGVKPLQQVFRVTGKVIIFNYSIRVRGSSGTEGANAYIYVDNTLVKSLSSQSSSINQYESNIWLMGYKNFYIQLSNAYNSIADFAEVTINGITIA